MVFGWELVVAGDEPVKVGFVIWFAPWGSAVMWDDVLCFGVGQGGGLQGRVHGFWAILFFKCYFDLRITAYFIVRYVNFLDIQIYSYH